MSTKSSRGMTMIEILVSLAIVTMMMVSVWASFSTTVRTMEQAGQIQDRYNMIRNAMDRMASEISMAYLSFNRPAGEPKHFTLFEGRTGAGGHSLTFSSFAHLRLRTNAKEGDQSIIQYELADDPEDSSRQHLYRRETPRLTGDRPEDLYRFAPAYVLCEDVESLEFRFWDPLREEWLDEWRTTYNDAQPDRLPTRVEIKMGIVDEVGDTVYFVTQVPLLMQEKVDLGK